MISNRRWKNRICLLFTVMLMLPVLMNTFFTKTYAETPQLISLLKPATAQSQETGHSPSLANDGDASNNSFWASSLGANNNTWWQVDLQGTYRVSTIRIRNWVDGSRAYHYYIRGSVDGIDWFPLVVKSNNNPATDSGDTYSLDTVARYIRVNVTHNTANRSAHISDFKVYGHPVSSGVSEVQPDSVATDRGSYAAGQTVRLSYGLRNPSVGASVTLTSVKAKISGLTNPLFLQETVLAENVAIPPGEAFRQTNAAIWSIPSGAAVGAYGIYLQHSFSDGTVVDQYQSFFRITSGSQQTVYQIGKQTYNGLDVYTLDGGMSAEYAVQKSAESLAQGVSHSWYLNEDRSGPNPVYSTPQFLEQAVQKTVSFYDNEFGAATKFDRVILSTGVASVPYLSRVMKAPVLPMHYLIGLDTYKELQSVLEYSNSNGLSSYAALGYARSMPGIGVAWVKLLGIPQAYIDFLNRHHVKQVILMGSSGTTGGETLAKKIVGGGVDPKGIQPGDMFVVYKQNASADDIAALTRNIKDYAEAPLEGNYRNISDWESGIVQEQIDRFSSTIKASTDVAAIDFVAGKSALELYDFATFAMLEFYKKNEAVLSADGALIRGVTLNPYLISHPFYESKIHYIPLLYWQGNTVSNTVDLRLNQTVRNAVQTYFPNIDFSGLNFWIDASRNFGGYAAGDIRNRLVAKGLTRIEMQDYNVDEIWSAADGIKAPSELIAQKMTKYSSAAALKAWDDSLVPISLSDLESIPGKYPGISVTRQ